MLGGGRFPGDMRIKRSTSILLLYHCMINSTLSAAQDTCLNGDIEFPPTTAFLQFMNEKAAAFYDHGILVHARTLPYKDAEHCRFAYMLKWLGDDGIVREIYFDADSHVDITSHDYWKKKTHFVLEQGQSGSEGGHGGTGPGGGGPGGGGPGGGGPGGGGPGGGGPGGGGGH